MNRREFLAVAGAACLALPGSAQQPATVRPPNVIVMLADDLGSVDLRCYGAQDLETPNLDALAARGIRFTQFYSAAPVCSPSRAALLTGRYPKNAGLENNVGGENGLQPDQVTLAEMFKAAGYRTAAFGKWHLGMRPEMSPLNQGFDEYFGHREGCTDNYSHFFYWSGPNRHDLWRNDAQVHEDGVFFPDLIVRETQRFLRENREQPFFLYLPFNQPHYPIQPETRFRDRFAGLPEPRAAYAAFVASLDEKVGQVLAEVDELGLRENTIVVFMSDNGHSVEERNFFGGGSAGPYRGHKFTLWEGGIRMPALLSWPGRLPEGRVCDTPAIAMDWMPTLASLCGVPLPERAIDGADLAPVFAEEGRPVHEVLHWQLGGHWAVREGPWKLVVDAPRDRGSANDPVWLSNLADDPGESRNVAESKPEIVAHLSELHAAWRRETP